VNLPYDPSGKRCAQGPQPGAMALRHWCMDRWPAIRDLGIFNCRPVRGGTRLSLHGEGRAWDAGLDANRPAEKKAGDELFRWAIANAATIGLQEAIWDKKTWTSRSEAVGPYRGQSSHRDHVHLGLNRQAAKSLTIAVLDATVEEDDMFTDADRALLKQAAKDAADAKKLASSANHQVSHPKAALRRVLDLVEKIAAKK